MAERDMHIRGERVETWTGIGNGKNCKLAGMLWLGAWWWLPLLMGHTDTHLQHI